MKSKLNHLHHLQILWERPDKVSWRGWKLIKSTPWKWTLLSYPRCQTSFAPHHLACWNCSSTNSNAKPFCLTSNEWETCDFRRLWRLKLVCGTNRTWQWPNIQDQMDQIKETQRAISLVSAWSFCWVTSQGSAVRATERSLLTAGGKLRRTFQGKCHC